MLTLCCLVDTEENHSGGILLQSRPKVSQEKAVLMEEELPLNSHTGKRPHKPQTAHISLRKTSTSRFWDNGIYFERDYKIVLRASLVVLWLEIHHAMQGTLVWSLVWEDSTCWGQAKPMQHDNWAWALRAGATVTEQWAWAAEAPCALEPTLLESHHGSPNTVPKSSPTPGS